MLIPSWTNDCLLHFEDKFGGPLLSSSTISCWLKPYAVNKLRSRINVKEDDPSSSIRVECRWCHPVIRRRYCATRTSRNAGIRWRIECWPLLRTKWVLAIITSFSPERDAENKICLAATLSNWFCYCQVWVASTWWVRSVVLPWILCTVFVCKHGNCVYMNQCCSRCLDVCVEWSRRYPVPQITPVLLWKVALDTKMSLDPTFSLSILNCWARARWCWYSWTVMHRSNSWQDDSLVHKPP